MKRKDKKVLGWHWVANSGRMTRYHRSACGVTYIVKSGSRGFKEAKLRVQDGHGLEGK